MESKVDKSVSAKLLKVKPYKWKEFLKIHEREYQPHPPEDWKIEWARLPKTLEHNAQGMPVYLKPGRTAKPECIQVYVNGKVVARRFRNGYWERFQHNAYGQVINYTNSLGAIVKNYWSAPVEAAPTEIHTGNNRWIHLFNYLSGSLYWCANTGLYKAGDSVFEREDLIHYFSREMWYAEANMYHYYDAAVALPATRIGRVLWRMRNPPQVAQ